MAPTEITEIPKPGAGGRRRWQALNGIDTGDRSGWSVSGAGDVNGDGVDDLLIGALYADPGGRKQTGFPVELDATASTICEWVLPLPIRRDPLQEKATSYSAGLAQRLSPGRR